MYPTLVITEQPKCGLAPCPDCRILVCLRHHDCPGARPR